MLIIILSVSQLGRTREVLRVGYAAHGIVGIVRALGERCESPGARMGRHGRPSSFREAEVYAGLPVGCLPAQVGEALAVVLPASRLAETTVRLFSLGRYGTVDNVPSPDAALVACKH